MLRSRSTASVLLALVLAAGCSTPAAKTAATSAAKTTANDSAHDESPPEATDPAPVGAPDAGGNVSAVPVNARVVNLEVGGMVCEACIVTVGRELRSVPGVYAASGDLGHQRFEVACDPGVADSSLVAAVRRAGPHYLGMIAE